MNGHDSKKTKLRGNVEEATNKMQKELSSWVNSLLGKLQPKKSNEPTIIVASPISKIT